MTMVKYAKADVLSVRSSKQRVANASLASFEKNSDYSDYRTEDGYLYVRVRAISSRVNKNHDGWPSSELERAHKSFMGKPIFVDHHNHDPSRARGVVADVKLHVEDTKKAAALDPYYASAPPEHNPPTWIELLLEVDARRFPKLAKAIIAGDIDSVSMGANVEMSKCSHCGNEAATPDEFCNHIRSKGAMHDFTLPDGTKTSKRSYEDCYKVGFFEISFVFDPADTTALALPGSLRHAHIAAEVNAEGTAHTADRHNDPPQSEMTTAPEKVNTLRQEQVCPVCGSSMEDGVCGVCNYEEPPEGFDNPDLDKAQEVDQEMRQDQAAGQEGTPIPAGADVDQPTPASAQPAPAGPMGVQSSTTTDPTPNAVSSDTLNGMSHTAADGDGPGRINVQEKPLLPAGRQTSDKPKGAQTVEDHREPVESNVKGATDMADQQHTADGPKPHGGADTAPDARVEVDGVGGVMDKPLSGVEHQNVEKAVTVTAPATETWTDGKGDSLGQESGVSHDTFPAKGDGVKSSSEHDAAAILNEDHAKTIDVEKPLTDDSKVADGTKTFGNPSNRTTDPVTDEPYPSAKDGVKAARAEGRAHALACVKLADAEIELGLTAPADKHNRISELEDLSLAEVEAQSATVARVRTAGLRRPVQANKTAATRIPSLQGGRTASVDPTEHAAPSSDQSVEDARAFL